MRTRFSRARTSRSPRRRQRTVIPSPEHVRTATADGRTPCKWLLTQNDSLQGGTGEVRQRGQPRFRMRKVLPRRFVPLRNLPLQGPTGLQARRQAEARIGRRRAGRIRLNFRKRKWKGEAVTVMAGFINNEAAIYRDGSGCGVGRAMWVDECCELKGRCIVYFIDAGLAECEQKGGLKHGPSREIDPSRFQRLQLSF